MYHRKRLIKFSAEQELESLAVADQIDPDDKWHIGHAVIENKVTHANGKDEIWTLMFKYGGRALSHLVDEPPHIIPLVLKGLSNVMDGLIQCHDHCLYHRDVKLDNILYTKEGVVRLIDFGIAITSLPDTGVDDLYDNIYVIWPFETQLLNGSSECIFSDRVYGEYVSGMYFQVILKLHELDPSECRANAITLKRKFPNKVELHKEIIKRIDVYSLGISLSHLLLERPIVNALDDLQYKRLKALSRKMIELYTLERISMEEALREYRNIFS